MNGFLLARNFLYIISFLLGTQSSKEFFLCHLRKIKGLDSNTKERDRSIKTDSNTIPSITSKASSRSRW